MSEAILCPQVGQDLTSAKVVALHVKLGDPVKKGDIVAEVESEKASFEVEAFSSGIVVELPYKVGEEATVLEPLVVLGAADAKPASARPAEISAPHPAASNSVFTLPNPTHAHVYNADGGVRSSPLARRLAQSSGLDVGGIAGTGPRGAVVMRDVEDLIAKGAKPLATAAAGAAALNIKNLKNGTGHPVLFIHGFGADLSAWRQMSTTISFANPMLALDLPGHGASPAIAKPDFAKLVEAVASALKAAGHIKLHLVGHSLGGAIATALSAKSGIDVLSLTLMSPAGLGVFVDGSFVTGLLSAKSEAALAIQMQRLVFDGAALPAAVVRATHAAREAGPLVAQQTGVAEAVFEGSTQLFSVKAELARFQRPARVILGKRDNVISPAESENAIPGHVALNRLENVGHLPFVEAPHLVERLIIETVRAGG